MDFNDEQFWNMPSIFVTLLVFIDDKFINSKDEQHWNKPPIFSTLIVFNDGEPVKIQNVSNIRKYLENT